jgi:hypothetical protein
MAVVLLRSVGAAGGTALFRALGFRETALGVLVLAENVFCWRPARESAR